MPNINDDIGHAETEELIAKTEREMRREYAQAGKEIQEKLDAYLNQFAKEDEKQRELLESGAITEQEYKDWRNRKILIGKHWEQMLEVISQDAVNVDMIAMSIVKGHMPEAYAIGHNYGTYLIESGIGIDTSYTLYDRQTVERLWRDNPKLLPDPSPGSDTAKMLEENDFIQARIKRNDPTLTEAELKKYGKDLRWNKQHIQNAVTQGILQGESLDKVASRLQQVTDMDERAARRNAATMLTSAQNGGRIDSYKRAESMGIKLKKIWLATLDGHVRTSHRMLDGEVKANDEAFSNGCMFPGDPNGAPEEIYNCRCTSIPQLNGHEIDPSNMDIREHSGLKGMSYEEWKNAKGDEPLFKAARNRKQDEKQFEEYQKLLGKNNIPKNLDEFQDLKYKTPDKWEELKKQARDARKAAKTVDNSGNGGIIEVGNTNITDLGDGMYRKRSSGKIEPMPKKQFYRIEKRFKAKGGIIQHNDETDEYLRRNKAEAITYNSKTILIKQNPGRASVFEELIHTAQYRDGKNDGTYRSRLECEIEAQKKLIRNAKAYKLTNVEVEQTKRALKSYEEELKAFLNDGGV